MSNEKQLLDDLKSVAKEARLMGCKEVRTFSNVPIENVEIIIESLEKKIGDRWIPVSDRLPDAKGKIIEVIVCDELASWESLYDKDIGFYTPFISYTNSNRLYTHVRAWMPKQPLPEPYKEGEEE